VELPADWFGSGADGREGILDTMIELRNQYALAFLRMLAVGHVDVDAYHPLRTPILTVRNRTTSLTAEFCGVSEQVRRNQAGTVGNPETPTVP
jgi:hypothetical protein